MLTSRQPVFRKFWHAVMPLSRLESGTPQPFTLLGEAIVLFLDADGRPAALKDRCCHRTAKLSKGRCVDGALECGYHGWTYDGGGRVIRIPQYEAERPIPPDYCTPAYRCVARHGYAWVALVAPGDEPLAPIPDMPEFGAPGWRTIFQFYDLGHQPAARAGEQLRQQPLQLRAPRHLRRGGAAEAQPLRDRPAGRRLLCRDGDRRGQPGGLPPRQRQQ